MFKKIKDSVNLDVIIISLIFMAGISLFIAFKPDTSVSAASVIFSFITGNIGNIFLWFGLLSLVAVLYLSFSKFGNIRLGEGKPEYSTRAWVTMIISAGIGSATVYWAYTEWALYYITPPFNIEPFTTEALEWGTPYNIFHWGVSAWSMYAITALPITYSLYIRKSGKLRLSLILKDILGEKIANDVVCKIIDIIFIFSAIGGLGITLGLSIPLVSMAITEVFGLSDTFSLRVIIVLAISILYSFSSYIGIAKGMQNISKINSFVVIAFLAFCLFVGPTQFILDNITNALGTMFQNYIKMSLWTDSIQGSDFPKNWTMFFWVYWLTYTPFVGLFIARISKGRTVRQVLIGLVFFGTLGTTTFFGIIGSYSLHAFMTGIVDVPSIIQNQDGYRATIEVIKSMPLPSLVLIAFAFMTIFFLATTLDSAAFTMASTTSKKLDQNNNPSAWLRLFWCIILSSLPLALMYVGAPLSTIQTCAFIGTVPLIFILMLMIIILFRWLYKDYGGKSADQIFKEEKFKIDK